MKKSDKNLIKSLIITKKELDVANQNFEHAYRRANRLLCISNEGK